MGRKSKTQTLIAGVAGQHLALSVAAHLARTQLVPDPLSVYDGQHISEMLELVAGALARVAPVFVRDAAGADPRELTAEELQGATIKRGATILALADGRSFSSATIKRTDLRQAIAILKATGIPRLAAQQAAAQPAAPAPAPNLIARLGEVEALLEPPLLGAQVARASQALVALAREAREGGVANRAMQLMSALHGLRDGEPPPSAVLVALAHLRAAVEELERA